MPRRGWRKGEPLEAKFWRGVVKAEGDACWEWAGRRLRGYGLVGSGRLKLAHRVSYELHYGPISEGLLVCHRCDNPGCVRPDHLWLGTHKDNAQDRDTKQRGAYQAGVAGPLKHVYTAPILLGEDNGHARLTEEHVREIRVAANGGSTQRVLAKQYGVTQMAISLIVRRIRWPHIE